MSSEVVVLEPVAEKKEISEAERERRAEKHKRWQLSVIERQARDHNHPAWLRTMKRGHVK